MTFKKRETNAEALVHAYKRLARIFSLEELQRLRKIKEPLAREVGWAILKQRNGW